MKMEHNINWWFHFHLKKFVTVNNPYENFAVQVFWESVVLVVVIVSYHLVAVWPVSEESEPEGHPAPVLEVLQQSAPRYDKPSTHSQQKHYLPKQ